MRVTTAHTEAAWRAEVKAGPTRPVARATIQQCNLRRHYYDTDAAPGGDYDHERSRRGVFTNILFGGSHPREVRNLRRITWTRSVDQDAAECTMTVLNADVLPMGDSESGINDTFELPGYFTFSRGDTTGEARWGYGTQTGWNLIMAPDRLVRTYEGYGSDDDVPPGDDPNLYLSGTWLIDTVAYTADGDITISMRDLARLLIDQIAFPPVIPWDDYPLTWSTIRSDQVESRDVTGGSWDKPSATATSSNNLYIGEGIVDSPTYVNQHGGVAGHYNNDPIRGDNTDWWLSTGQDAPDGYVWWQQEFDSPQDMNGVKINTIGGPYRIFISLQRQDGSWYGKRTIPYEVSTEGVNLNGDIRFVHSLRAERGEPLEISLARRYRNVKKLRLTFTRLRRHIGGKYPWRAGLRDIEIYKGNYDDLGFAPGTVLTPVGNISDFTDAVKWMLAWTGFYWPSNAQDNWIAYRSGENAPQIHYEYEVGDSRLPHGRVWGSFQNTSTAPIADMTPDQFDKQPIMDCINVIKDIIGFNFWVDEAGGPTWRQPNLFELGNYVSPHHKLPRRAPARTTDIVTIDEEETLISYSTTLSSRNLRDYIFVGDANGKRGVTIRGYNPVKIGMRRAAGWTDSHFETNYECRVAADMIAARQMFDWRRAKITIPGNPAIQIDDQIRVWERITNETYYHYVIGISSTLENDTGVWTYELDTHWLGEDPTDAWVVRIDDLDGMTQAYLNALGGVD